MSTNPRPQKIIAVLDGQGSVMQADACRPEWADSPKVKRGVPGIVPQECEASISLAPDGLGEPTIARPEAGRRSMVHKSVQRPPCQSSRAS